MMEILVGQNQPGTILHFRFELKGNYMLKKIYYLIISTIFIFGINQNIYTQELKLPMQYGDRPAQYILGDKDVLLISVNLWGHVQRPGIYSIPSHFSIIDLLSSAGGPLKSARLNDIRIIRKDQEVLTINIEEYIKTGRFEVLPSLQPGDVVIVPGSISDIFSRIVSTFRDMAIVANVIVLWVTLNKR